MEQKIPIIDSSEEILSYVQFLVTEIVKQSEIEVDKLAKDVENLSLVLKEHYKQE